MKIVLIRHAEAGERDPTHYPDDDLRPVSVEGRRRMIAIARAMKDMGVRFDQLLSSPLVRALQTAAIVAEVFETEGGPQANDALGHACTAASVTTLLAQFLPDARVALVGHEPALSAVAAAMISRSGDARIELKKGGAIGIEFESVAAPGKGILQFHLKPGHLKRIGKS